jgi:WD40 repeat protein
MAKGSLSNNQVDELFGMLSNDSKAVVEARTSSNRLRQLESNPNAPLVEIYKERQRSSQIRKKLDAGNPSRNDVSFASGFENVVMQEHTNFQFDPKAGYRPVKLRFADRFLYAARPSILIDPESTKAVAPDAGDDGALLSWEYRITQLPSREWTLNSIQVTELFSLPNSGGVFTAPSMMLFSQADGSSKKLPDAMNWDASRAIPGSKQLFAMGSAGGDQIESEILRIFDLAKMGDENLQPESRYVSYEGSITALAFANKSTNIAFCVRERTGHRLFIADSQRLNETLTLVDEQKHDTPWIAKSGSRAGPPGVTAIAFSPDDRLLVAHGKYNGNAFKFTTWKLNWNANGKATSVKDWDREESARPMLAELNSRPIRFIQDARAKSGRMIVYENESAFHVMDLNTRNVLHRIPYLAMQSGRPETFVSEDGRWLIMGDDRGNVLIWDLTEGTRFSIAYSSKKPDSPKQKANPGASPKDKKGTVDKDVSILNDRPAHKGPVVGVTLSPPGLQGGFPEFAATIGEENQLIIWDLIPVLGGRNLTTSKTLSRSVSQ